MFTLVGWAALTSNAALTAIAGLADPHVRVSGTDIYVPSFASQLLATYALGTTLTQAQLRSPSILARYPIEIEPADVAAIPASPVAVNLMFGNPLQLQPTEPLDAWTKNSSATLTQVLAWLGDKSPAPVTGQIFTAKATTSTTLTANVWSNAALTFVTNLPAGDYDIVGARAESTNLQAFRFVLPGAFNRPGGLGVASIGKLGDIEDVFRFGRLGVWGTFNNIVPPTVDFLANVGDSNPSVWLDLMKHGA